MTRPVKTKTKTKPFITIAPDIAVQEKEFTVVGKPVNRVDALEKVTGKAIYTVDLKLPNMLYGKVLQNKYAHARITRIDTSKAEVLPGVVAVVTGKDFPALHGETMKDKALITLDKVRYVGEPIAAVAAETEDIAEQAVSLIEVEYEILPHVLDPVESMKPGAPLIHENLMSYQKAGDVYPVEGTNILTTFKLRRGDVEKGFAESDYVIERTYKTAMASHAAIEPHACVVWIDIMGRYNVWNHNDAPHRARKELADALKIPFNKVKYTATYSGGNFGGKGGLKTECIAIMLAMKTRGRPVKVVMTREEVFNSAIVKHPTIITIKSGVKKDGTLISWEVKTIYDTGAYAEKGPTVMRQGTYTAGGPYRIPNVKIDGYCVYTNKPIAGAFRGYGNAQVAWAYESHIDEIAEMIGMDPLEIRLKNCFVEGDISHTGQVLRGVGLKESLEKAAEAINWEEEPSAPNRGKGIACAHKNTKTPSSSAAFIKVEEDGVVDVLTSIVEVGMGARTVISQIAAEEMHVSLNRVFMQQADTDFTPFDSSSTSSRTTFHVGNAVRAAAIDCKNQLLEMASKIFNVPAAELEIKDGKIFPKGAADKAMDYGGIIRKAFGPGGGGTVLGRGVYCPVDATGLDKETGQGANPSVFWMYGAQGAEVEVDEETGNVKVLRVTAVQDVGKAINPQTCEQQIDGAVVMGMGSALFEEIIFGNGNVINKNFLDYKLPTAIDAPDIMSILVEAPHPEGPYGAKGIGEGIICPTAPAIANAIYDATGVRVREIPITTEKLLKALKEKTR